MIHPFVAKLNEKNLCTWYLLPLLDLNIHSFAEGNLIDTYVIEGKMQLGVLLADLNLCSTVVNNPYHVQTIEYKGCDLLVYDIPEEWSEDFRLYLAGSYSKMSGEIKSLIRRRCGLKYKQRNENGKPITDAILMALERHDNLAQKWYEILRVPELPHELLDKPREKDFIHI